MLHGSIANLSGQLSTTAPAALPPRRAERREVKIGAGLRQRGAGGVTIDILDLSTHGFRAHTHLDLATGADVWLKLPGLESWQSRVAWVEGYIIGCEFIRPLHPAVLDNIVRSTRR
jgi:hypothetical protein